MSALLYSENVALSALILTPLAGMIALKTKLWQPSMKGAVAAVVLWVAVQRFIAAGLRIPGKFTATPGSMKGKVALVTGANTGIGFWTAVGLAEAGATVVITCRDAAKCSAAVREIKAIAGASADVRSIEMELDELAKVRRAANAFKAMRLPLHVLVNNAGAVVAPVNGRFMRTPDGLEITMGCNFVAPVLLVDELLPLLKASRGRVVNVSSSSHITCGSAADVRRLLDDGDRDAVGNTPGRWTGLGGAYRRYAVSKLCNIYHVKELAARYPEITAVSVHPGSVVTDIWRVLPCSVARGVLGGVLRCLLPLFLFKTCPEGAVTTLIVATAPNVKNGAYYADGAVMTPHRLAHDQCLRDEAMHLAYRRITTILT
jgi:NAD(P)-dependent dehydrogenase (short-subunit alcohol dehydrogenase family)